MKRDSFASSLVRKGERAIRSAQLSLRDGDPDNAVNRSYKQVALTPSLRAV
jgi:hypothetical protein